MADSVSQVMTPTTSVSSAANVESLSVAEVCHQVRRLGLLDLATSLREQEISGANLCEMNPSTWKGFVEELRTRYGIDAERDTIVLHNWFFGGITL